MSQQIKELEETLGAALFERGARQVRLTSFGEEFALRVHDILRSIDELEGLARASRERLLGRLRIGMIPTVAPYLLPTLIRGLTRAYADLDINVRETLTPKLIQELAEGRLDTAIVALPVSEPSFDEVALFAEDFLLVRPGEDEGKPTPDVKTLREMRLLLLEEGHCFRDQALSFCNLHSAQAARIVGRKLSVDAGPDGRRRNRRDIDSGNGGRGGDAFGARVRHAVRQSEAFANHRHDLAPDQSIDQTAYADFGRRASFGRRVA